MIHQCNGGGSTSRLYILQYLRHLRSRDPLPDKLDSEEAILETSYLDTLQSPLQPLGDHLEYQTYETFEKDPVKYKRYGEAIENALIDGMRGNMFTYSTLEMKDFYEVTILVVGAGRGPLVNEAIGAVARASASLKTPRTALHANIIAIEKNPSAVLYLHSLKGSNPSWNDGKDPHHDDDDDMFDPNDDENIAKTGTSNVTIICCDMREATSHPTLRNMIMKESCRADIVVSELLGSFGDNELSPECLDGVQKCGLLKNNCISIPQRYVFGITVFCSPFFSIVLSLSHPVPISYVRSFGSYTAFIAPVSSARLYSEAKIQSCHPLNNNEGPASPPVGMQRAMETPYVVRSHAASQTHPEEACWVFYHPKQPQHRGDDVSEMTRNNSVNPGDKHNASALGAENVINDRHANISFTNDPNNGCCLGCGYGPVDTEVEPYIAAAAGPEGMLSSTSNDVTLTIHGFLGTFHSVLYRSPPRDDDGEEIESVISIASHSFSRGMFSWFPLVRLFFACRHSSHCIRPLSLTFCFVLCINHKYFPLKEPLRVPPGATLTCSIWRRSDRDRVWYEWCAEVVVVNETEPDKDWNKTTVLAASSLHNPGGRSYHVKK